MSRFSLRILGPLAMCVALASLLPDTASAQIVASERSTLSQTIDGTVITIDYSRPSARGRAPLFGGVMPYGEIITPGANMATTLEVSRDITINDVDVPAGKYSVWVAFDGPEAWRLGLDETWQRFHGPHPTADELEIMIPITPHDSPADLETLTFHFPSIHRDDAVLSLHWGATAVDMAVHVQPTPMENISAESAEPYVGKYSVDVVKIPPFTIYDGTVEMDFRYENGFLHTWMDIGPYSDPHNLAFFPKAEQVLYGVELIHGEPANNFGDMILFEFQKGDSGMMDSFQARVTQTDAILFTGTRIE